MDAGRALVRLWLFGTIAWVGFWVWRDGSGCFHAKNGTLWCPNAAGDMLGVTTYLHIVLNVLGPPVMLYALALTYSWFARSQSSLD